MTDQTVPTVIEAQGESVNERDCVHGIPEDNCHRRCVCGHTCRSHINGMCGRKGECPCTKFDDNENWTEYSAQDTIPLEDIPTADIPVYTVAAAIDWVKRPENDARIKSMVEKVKEAERTFVQAVDRDVSKVGRLLVDMATSDDILEDFSMSLLSSITGIGR